MPVGDINRSGPNQDVNDPSILIEVGLEFNNTSVANGNALAKYLQEDPEASGNKIVDIIIPLKTLTGEVDFDCANIERNEIDETLFDYDKVLWSGGLINTYVNLAERFRDYWTTLNTIIGIVEDINTVEIDSISPHPTGNIDSFTTSGSLGGTSYNGTRILFFPSGGSLPEPVWLGVGPSNYNSGTYPQLLEEAFNVRISTVTELFPDIREIYYWQRVSRSETTGTGANRTLSVEVRDSFVAPVGSRIEIPNFTDEDLEIDIEAISSYSRTATGTGVGASISLEFSQVFGNVFIGTHGLLVGGTFLTSFDVTDGITSTISGNFDGSVSYSASHNETIVIPPHKSGYFVIQSRNIASLTFLASATITGLASSLVTLNAMTRNHSFNFVYP